MNEKSNQVEMEQLSQHRKEIESLKLQLQQIQNQKDEVEREGSKSAEKLEQKLKLLTNEL